MGTAVLKLCDDASTRVFVTGTPHSPREVRGCLFSQGDQQRHKHVRIVTTIVTRYLVRRTAAGYSWNTEQHSSPRSSLSGIGIGRRQVSASHALPCALRYTRTGTSYVHATLHSEYRTYSCTTTHSSTINSQKPTKSPLLWKTAGHWNHESGMRNARDRTGADDDRQCIPCCVLRGYTRICDE